jgi:hypothetical protein
MSQILMTTNVEPIIKRDRPVALLQAWQDGVVVAARILYAMADQQDYEVVRGEVLAWLASEPDLVYTVNYIGGYENVAPYTNGNGALAFRFVYEPVAS